MSDRFCSHCGARLDDEGARRCPLCGHEVQPPADETPPREERESEAPEPPPAPEERPILTGPPPSEPAVPVAPGASGPVTVGGACVPPDGQRRCPHCGEALYSGERVCWSCKRRVDLYEAAEEAETGPMTRPLPGAPGPPPAAMPGQSPPDVEQVRAPARAGGVQAPAAPEAPPEAMATAWWAFGLGLVSVFTCGLLGLLGPVAIWLGISANRRGAGPVAIAGIVFGVLGTLVILAVAILLLLAMMMTARMAPSHVLLPTLDWSVLMCAA